MFILERNAYRIKYKELQIIKYSPTFSSSGERWGLDSHSGDWDGKDEQCGLDSVATGGSGWRHIEWCEGGATLMLVSTRTCSALKEKKKFFNQNQTKERKKLWCLFSLWWALHLLSCGPGQFFYSQS